MVASWTTDAPAGFSDADQIEMLAAIMPALTLAFMLRTTNRAARTLITTYLGSDAAERVLAGNIVRGRAEPIRAVVWFSDLVGFTRISDTVSADVMLALLNDYAEAQVEEIEAHGGHVLKFMGDGILAIFPDDETTRACKRALDAAANAATAPDRRAERATGSRRAAGDRYASRAPRGRAAVRQPGQPAAPRLHGAGTGGQRGGADRGAVRLARAERHRVVGVRRGRGRGARGLVSLGRYAMKGIARPQELFTLDPGRTIEATRAVELTS